MFENLLKRCDDAFNDALDVQYICQKMSAEMSLSFRLGLNKQTLINSVKQVDDSDLV